jgi:adenylate cyclase
MRPLGILVVLAICSCIRSIAQEPRRPLDDRRWADSVFHVLESSKIIDFQGTLALCDRMMTVYRANSETCMMAKVAEFRGDCFDRLGQLDSSMAVIQQGLAWFHSGCDSSIYMSLQATLSTLYVSLRDPDRVDSTCTAALLRWNPTWPNSKAHHALLQNRAIAFALKGEMTKALDAFRNVLAAAHLEQNKADECGVLTNLGAAFNALARNTKESAYFDSAATYYTAAAGLAERINNPHTRIILLTNLASLTSDRGRTREALLWLDTAGALATSTHDLQLASSIELDKSVMHYRLGDKDEAYDHLSIHLTLKDSLLNEEKIRAVADVREKYETEKKAKENATLRAENLEVELDRARVKRIRNILWLGLAFAVTFGSVFFFQRNRISKARKRSDELLLNILPSEVAEELKDKGAAEARHFEQATILFTDFKGFTQASERMSPQELVEELNTCFKAFDHIITARGIEKIKTIGDAYMCAGGLPVPSSSTPAGVVQAALEMQAFMVARKVERDALGKPSFEMRVGIHTGPVVAGIVGVKKFQYDIWGDTVNTASRMESCGEVGQVNISEATYELVKDVERSQLSVVSSQLSGSRTTDNQQPTTRKAFTFTPRGKVQAKGKGEMEMYFVR